MGIRARDRLVPGSCRTRACKLPSCKQLASCASPKGLGKTIYSACFASIFAPYSCTTTRRKYSTHNKLIHAPNVQPVVGRLEFRVAYDNSNESRTKRSLMFKIAVLHHEWFWNKKLLWGNISIEIRYPIALASYCTQGKPLFELGLQ